MITHTHANTLTFSLSHAPLQDVQVLDESLFEVLSGITLSLSSLSHTLVSQPGATHTDIDTQLLQLQVYIHPSNHSSILMYPSTHLSITNHLTVYPSIHPSLHLSVHPLISNTTSYPSLIYSDPAIIPIHLSIYPLTPGD